MLLNLERDHCRRLLELLSPTDIYSLKDTVTKNAVLAECRSEAINVILDYSESTSELLHRKKIKRDIIFQYLHKENIRVDPSSNKEQLIGYVVSLSPNPSISLPSPLVPDKATKLNSSTTSGTQLLECPASSTVYLQQVSNAIAQTDQQISKEFVGWFYPLLNSLHGQSTSNTTWTAKHFWPDCRFRCKFPLNEGSGENEYQFETLNGAELVHGKLAQFVRQHRLLFNVNDTPSGHRGRINSHGLAKVAACGTLHKIVADGQIQSSFGTFEQLFGLLRDPTEDFRWKIMFTDLSIDNVMSGGTNLSETSLRELLAD